MLPCNVVVYEDGRARPVKEIDPTQTIAAQGQAGVRAVVEAAVPSSSGCSPASDVMKRIAAQRVGGLATSFPLELLVPSAIYLLWKQRTELPRLQPASAETA